MTTPPSEYVEGFTHVYTIPVSPKSLRESINIIYGIVARHPEESFEPFHSRTLAHLALLGAECDRKRPTGSGGKHGDRHTRECGCTDNPLNRWVCPVCRGSGWSTLRQLSPRVEPVSCEHCEGRGWVTRV